MDSKRTYVMPDPNLHDTLVKQFLKLHSLENIQKYSEKVFAKRKRKKKSIFKILLPTKSFYNVVSLIIFLLSVHLWFWESVDANPAKLHFKEKSEREMHCVSQKMGELFFGLGIPCGVCMDAVACKFCTPKSAYWLFSHQPNIVLSDRTGLTWNL